ncbi:MAG: hypothetical protein KGJ66_15105 [Alphaproteobacteria bacterium]|nr:hypothetical protein [Alphaproteobacteria bacterium]
MSASSLDQPIARLIAAGIAVVALGLVAWLAYIDNREDPAIAACIKQHTAAIARARDRGALPADVAQRFLAKVEESCRDQAGSAAR